MIITNMILFAPVVLIAVVPGTELGSAYDATVPGVVIIPIADTTQPTMTIGKSKHPESVSGVKSAPHKDGLCMGAKDRTKTPKQVKWICAEFVLGAVF